MKELLKRYNKLYESGVIKHKEMSMRIGIDQSVFYKWRDPRTSAVGRYDNILKFKKEIEKLEKLNK